MEEEKFGNSYELMEICYDKLDDLDVNNNSIDDEIDYEKTSEIDVMAREYFSKTGTFGAADGQFI